MSKRQASLRALREAFPHTIPILTGFGFLGAALPAAIFAMLVVYCLKNVSILSGSHGIPEAVAICAVVGVHLWKKNTLLSILSGTVIYMLLVQLVF